MELIQQLVQQLGVSDQQAKGGTGLILNAVKSKLSGDDFSQVMSAIPGSRELIDAAPQQSSVSNALGGLISSVSGSDSKLGTLASLAGGFDKLNLDSDMIGKFVPIVLSFVQSKGGDTMKNLLTGVLR